MSALPNTYPASDAGSDTSMEDDTTSQHAATTPATPIPLDTAPPGVHAKPIIIPTTIPKTPFATPYRSPFLLQKEHAHLVPTLHHLNCSYLSTPGLAPSLTHLKAHAQSLCILIKVITLSTKNSIINIKNENLDIEYQTAETVEGETWDFLNDLSMPYTGPCDENLRFTHDLPLTALLNTQKLVADHTHPEGERQEDRCPLYHPRPQDLHTNGTSLPYATHQVLISHANRILELLDHEYSAKGGLLAILPPECEKEEREKAESTLLGQYILYTQQLVSRLHELERELANALDVVEGESVVPPQMLSKLGIEGRKGREVCYPQDRFVLVNAGHDVWDFLDQEFREKERVDELMKENYMRGGLMGQSLWMERGGKEFARGINAIDITTRYFRLRNDPLKTVFVIPAWEKHPGVKATVDMEKVPSVISVVKPVWPERQSLWEQRERGKLAEVKRLEREVESLRQEEEWAQDTEKVLVGDNERKDGWVRHLTRERDLLKAMLDGETATDVQKKVYADFQAVVELEKSAKKDKEEARQLQLRARQAMNEANAAKQQNELIRKETEDRQQELAERRTRQFEAASRRVNQQDRDAGVRALELESKLKEVLGEQVKEAQVIIEWLRSRKVAFEDDLIRQEAVDHGRTVGQKLVDEVTRGVSFASLGAARDTGAGNTAGGPSGGFGGVLGGATRAGAGSNQPRGGDNLRGRMPFGDGARSGARGPVVDDV